MECLKEKKLLIPVDGAKLYCRVFENKNPPLIVMHGGPGLGQGYLLPQMASVGNFSSAVFYDQRGTGQSTGTNHWQSSPFETYVHDVEQLREAFGFERVSLLAHSWGGILASLYALAYPERVDKIIYLNSVPIAGRDYLAYVKHRSQLVDVNQDKLTVIRESVAFSAGDPTTVERYYRIYFRHYFAKPDKANSLTLKMSAKAAINNFKIFDLFYERVKCCPFDLYEGMKALKKPTLIVGCDKDVIPLHYTEKLHHSIPTSTFFLIKDSGHFPYIDQPETLFKILEDFIRD